MCYIFILHVCVPVLCPCVCNCVCVYTCINICIVCVSRCLCFCIFVCVCVSRVPVGVCMRVCDVFLCACVCWLWCVCMCVGGGSVFACYSCMHVHSHYLLLSPCRSISLLLFPFIFSAGGKSLYDCLAVPQAYRPFSSRDVRSETEQKKLSKYKWCRSPLRC